MKEQAITAIWQEAPWINLKYKTIQKKKKTMTSPDLYYKNSKKINYERQKSTTTGLQTPGLGQAK